jgi:hypothetical protein
VLEGQAHIDVDQPLMLTEFGGIALARGVKGTWGYSSCSTPEDFARLFTRLIEVVRSLSLLAGFCYTQFADTYQEANGLLNADRTPKFALQQIARVVGGRAAPQEGGLEQLQAATEPSEVR